MPVEDASVEWDETVSKPIPVAILTIGVQDVDSTEGRALAEACETTAFSPWNAMAEHRPMGGIKRLRQAVYLASFELCTSCLEMVVEGPWEPVYGIVKAKMSPVRSMGQIADLGKDFIRYGPSYPGTLHHVFSTNDGRTWLEVFFAMMKSKNSLTKKENRLCERN